LYNQFVEMYCDHHGLEVKTVDRVNRVFENGREIGHFDDSEKIITFNNGVSVRKGDLILSILEGTNLHS